MHLDNLSRRWVRCRRELNYLSVLVQLLADEVGQRMRSAPELAVSGFFLFSRLSNSAALHG